MAARKTVSKTGPRRGKSVAIEAGSAAAPALTSLPQLVEDAIEAERDRLMQAHTLLSCAALAMDAEDLSFEGPHYLTVIEMARDLVNQAINNLEPMALESAAQRAEHAVDDDDGELDARVLGRNRVREPVFAYPTH
jgi:leucyl aminopeptidase